jgi:hypothetical protein
MSPDGLHAPFEGLMPSAALPTGGEAEAGRREQAKGEARGRRAEAPAWKIKAADRIEPPGVLYACRAPDLHRAYRRGA